MRENSDTFAQLRTARERKLHDLRTRCFICDNDAQLFDKLGRGFEYHIQFEHHMWNYLHYYIYVVERVREIRSRPPGDTRYLPLNGTDQFMFNNFFRMEGDRRVRSTRFFPTKYVAVSVVAGMHASIMRHRWLSAGGWRAASVRCCAPVLPRM